MRGAEDRKDADLRTMASDDGPQEHQAEQYLEPLRGTEDRPIGRFFPH